MTDQKEPEGIVSMPLEWIIVAPERLSRLREHMVDLLMQAIVRRGLLSPIRVAPTERATEYRLVVGLHRYVAHERLGLEEIQVVIDDGDPVTLELDEIEENLLRQEWTVLERARMEKRQKELYLLVHPDTRAGKAGGQARQGQQPTAMSLAEQAARPGSGVRMAERRIQVANALSDKTVRVLRDTPLAENLTQLVELARIPEEQRHPIAVALAKGKAKTVHAARWSVFGVRKPPNSTEGQGGPGSVGTDCCRAHRNRPPARAAGLGDHPNQPQSHRPKDDGKSQV